MTFAVPKVKPKVDTENIKLKLGARRMIVLFLLTILTAICYHQFLHLPPAVGMMTGLSYLMFFSYQIRREDKKNDLAVTEQFNFFRKVERAEWDTLFIFLWNYNLCRRAICNRIFSLAIRWVISSFRKLDGFK